MRPLHRLALVCFALVFLSGVFSIAQNVASKPLIVEKFNENQLIMLKGNTPPAANAQNDHGQVSPGMSMSGLVLVLRRSPEQQAAFDAFVASQYDATSPNYHHWLEPEEVGEKFGPAMADIATVSSWLSSHGLAVEAVSKDRMTIRFSGSASQVEGTFHTEIHNLVVKGEPHISNMSDPQIPMALEPVVLGPKALHNFIPKPLHRTGGKATLNKETGKWEHAPTSDVAIGGVRPDFGFTTCGTSSCLIEDVAPYDFATIYNVLPLWNASSPIDGTGQTIAIAGRSDVRATDVTAFRNTFGLKGGAFNLIMNGTDPGFCTSTSPTAPCTLDDQIENALDVEWSGAVAPKATVDLVVTQQTNTNDAIFESAQYIITNQIAQIINVSYGQCELFEGTSGNAAYNDLWQTAAAARISVFVATGDSGSPSCDQDIAPANGPYGAQDGLSVSGIASSQYDTAVGGTDFNWGSTAAPYWNTTNNTTNGSTAAGYVPEVPWNDTCTNPIVIAEINTALNQNLSASQICYDLAVESITTNPEQQALDLVNVVGGGGGASNCTTNSTISTTTNPDPTSCSGGYAKPTWQTGVTGIPTDGKRDVPDVSFFAGNGFLGSAYLICVSDWGTCVSSPTTATEPAVGEIGGTSAASPAMAGVMALINQKAGSAQGSPNAELYVLAGKQTYASCTAESVTASGGCYFNDIDTGTNAMPCAAGSLNCTLAATGNTYGVLTGFAAGSGYDEATGLGSLNVANVVNAFSGSGSTTTGTATATVTVTAASNSIDVGQTLNVTAAVTGTGATPTGTVTLSGGGYTSSSQTLVAGSYTFAIPANSLSAGMDNLTVNYSGDATYATGSGSASVTVTASVYALVATAPAAVSPGSSATSTITLNSTTAYTGTVTLTCALTASPAGASDLPTCAPASGGGSITATAGTAGGTGSVTVSTTAATTSAMKRPRVGGWAETESGIVLALLVFFGIPARRRGWRATLGAFVLLATLGSLAACGGGGSSSGGGGGNPGTTAGSYTFTVTGTGSDPAKTKETTTFTVTVN
ncbi:MAG: S53 family peptidase [Terracidiphilus sp.]